MSVPTYASAAYGCALAHSPQTTREVRATFYSRLSQYGPHAASCTFGREGPSPDSPGGGPPLFARPVSIGPHHGWGRSHRRSIHAPLWGPISRGTGRSTLTHGSTAFASCPRAMHLQWRCTRSQESSSRLISSPRGCQGQRLRGTAPRSWESITRFMWWQW